MRIKKISLLLFGLFFCVNVFGQKTHIKIKLIEKSALKEGKIIQLWNKNTGKTHLEFLDSLGVATFRNFKHDVDELYVLNLDQDVIGKISFVFKQKNAWAKRSKEAIVILHNDLVAYQNHPTEKENKLWAFANYYQYNYQHSHAAFRIGKQIHGVLYPTSMLIPPANQSTKSYLFSNIRPDKKPILFVHGVTGTDNYWGGEDLAIVYPKKDKVDNDFNQKKDYLYISYSGRLANLEKENFDVWEYYYPPDQSWRESGYLLARDVKTLIKNYNSKQKITIIAHSMGGLVARAYIENIAKSYLPLGKAAPKLDFENEIDKVLFLGTPQHGSFGGNRLTWGIFLPGKIQSLASGKDDYAPANRDLAIGNKHLLALNNKENLNNSNVKYLQIGGTTWQGLIPGISCLPSVTESLHHEDGIVSISAGNLLSFGIDLGLLDRYSHAHLNSPDNEDAPLNFDEKQVLPYLMQDFINNGKLTHTKSYLLTYIDAKKLNEMPATLPSSICDSIHLDITLPIVSFKNSETTSHWIHPKTKRAVRFKLMLREHKDSKKKVITLEKQYFSKSYHYNSNGMFLYYGENNFAKRSNKYKRHQQRQITSFFGYGDSADKNPFDMSLSSLDISSGVGWHLPFKSDVKSDVYLCYKVRKVRVWNNWYFAKIPQSLDLAWSRAVYTDIFLSPQALKILNSNQALSQELPQSIKKRNTKTLTYNYIDPATLNASFALKYQGEQIPKLELVNPLGEVFASQNTDNQELSFVIDKELKLIYTTIENPLSGKWAVLVNGKSDYDKEKFEISFPMEVKNPLLIEIDNLENKGIYQVKINLEELNYKIEDLVLNVELIDEENNIEKLLFKEINAANFEAKFTPKFKGNFQIIATLNGKMNGHTFIRQSNYELVVREIGKNGQ